MTKQDSATPDAGALLASSLDIAGRVTRDLCELRRTLDRVGSEEEADFVGEIADEFQEFAQHLTGLKEKRAGLPSHAPGSVSACPAPRFSE